MNPLKIAINLLYILQLEEYSIPRFWKWVKTHRRWIDLQKKRRLIWTFKAKLIFALAVVIWLGAVLAIPVLIWTTTASIFFTGVGAIIAALIFFALIPVAIITSAALVSPVARFAKFLIYKKAQRKINSYQNLKVIGISGSFGKTSVKEILAKILETRFAVLKTPQNINTDIGIANFILRELLPSHQALIVEMGAYHQGDTRSIARMVKPSIGILTGLNEQHLERFGSLQNAIATESELLEELPPGGIAILNEADAYYQEAVKYVPPNVTIHSHSLSRGNAGSLKLSGLEISEKGSRFLLEDESRQKYILSTHLLGRHNIVNILHAALAARALGLTLEEISRAVSELKPFPHRLNRINRENDIIILDDSYNINPDGAIAALETLALFKNRRKIVVTHGLVELGELGPDRNRQFGRDVTHVADLIIAAGPNSNFISEGAINAGFAVEKLFQAENIDEATRKLQSLSRSGDVILIQADLPDTYAE